MLPSPYDLVICREVKPEFTHPVKIIHKMSGRNLILVKNNNDDD